MKWLNLLSAIVVLIIGLIIGLVVLLFSNAGQAFPAFITILTFGVSSLRHMGNVLLHATPIILTGLSVAFAFKTGLFNIGATGQFTLGGFAAVFLAIHLEFLPVPLRILVAITAAAAAGALWGAIPGMLKAFRNVHEVISCIMTNYIGMFLVNFLIINYLFDRYHTTSIRIPSSSALPTLGMQGFFRDNIRTSDINMGIIIAALIAVLVYVILEKTTFGYELKACGFNKDAAKYAGISENRSIVFSMMISGALAGIGGALFFLNDTGLRLGTVDALRMEGFTGISVAFLGLNHPIGIIFSGILVSYLLQGGSQLQRFGFSIEVVEIVISVIIYFCAFVFLVKNFLAKGIAKIFRKAGDES